MADTDPDLATELRIEPRVRRVGDGEVRRLLPYRERRMVGPFIYTDLIGPEVLDRGVGLDVDAHPHIGLATVTYLFDGRIVHRDSTGAVATIEPGAVNWMTAGAGVCHTERSHPDDRTAPSRLHGIQTWVALADGDDDGAPSFQHQPAPDAPTERYGTSEVTVAVGSGWGLEAAVDTSSPLILADVRLTGDGLALDDTHPERAVLAIDGDVTLDGRVVPTATMVVVAPGPRTLGGAGRAVVLGGAPVGPRHIWWNFVHRDRDRIEQAKDDWRLQRFPRVPGDHDPFVPLPRG